MQHKPTQKVSPSYIKESTVKTYHQVEVTLYFFFFFQFLRWHLLCTYVFNVLLFEINFFSRNFTSYFLCIYLILFSGNVTSWVQGCRDYSIGE